MRQLNPGSRGELAPAATIRIGGPTTPASGKRDVDVRAIWGFVRRNFLLIALCGVGLGGLGVLYSSRVTPIYEAGVKIRIDEQQSSLPVLDALKSISTGDEIHTEMQVLETRTTAEEVVDAMALQVVLEEPRRVRRETVLDRLVVSRDAEPATYVLTRTAAGAYQMVNDSTGQVVGAARVGEPARVPGASFVLTQAAATHPELTIHVAQFEDAVAHFMRNTFVTRPQREGNLIHVRHRGSDPALVRDAPNVMARVFIAGRNTVQKTEARSTIAFLEDQIAMVKSQLTESENALRTFREDAQVVSLAEEARAQVARVADLQAERNAIDAERSALQALLTSVEAAERTTGPGDPSPYRRLLSFPTLFREQSTSTLLQALTQIENERAALLTRRRMEDADVMILTERIEQIEDQLRTTATTYLEGLGNQVRAADASLARYGSMIEQIPAREVQFARLMREPKVLEELYVTLQTRLKEAEIAAAIEDPSVRVVETAILPRIPVKPNKPLVVLLAGFLGLVLGTMIALWREYMDRSVRTRDHLQLVTGLPVLGLIPTFRAGGQLGGGAKALPIHQRISPRSMLRALAGASNGNGSGAVAAPESAGNERLITNNDPRNPVSEAYRKLRTSISFASADGNAKTLLFTSALPAEGKSTTTANVAITLAQQGLRVLLVDADMRRGLLHQLFNFGREPGLSNVLFGAVDLAAAARSVELGSSGRLDFLATGTLPPNPAELLGSDRMRAMLTKAEESYDIILLDTPPLNLVTDAALLGTVVDGVVVVARSGVTSTDSLAYAMEHLNSVKARVLGTILNDVDFQKDATYHGGYGYSYEYQYGGS